VEGLAAEGEEYVRREVIGHATRAVREDRARRIAREREEGAAARMTARAAAAPIADIVS
jgi:hypothetical protein